MCGRFTLATTPDELAREFDLNSPPAVRPRYNIAPTKPIAVVAVNPQTERNGLRFATWGFIPPDAASPTPAPFSARLDSLNWKGMFSESFATRRCLVPATGFYVWEKFGDVQVPHYINLRHGRVVAFAGLWSAWQCPESRKWVYTACLITTPPNHFLRALTDRQPAVLRSEDYGVWLDDMTPLPDLVELLRPFPPNGMEVWQVGDRVNSWEPDDPELIAPLHETAA